MKAILEFNLPEEQEEYGTYLSGPRAICALTELAEYLRSLSKQDRESVEVEKVVLKFWEIVQENEVVIW